MRHALIASAAALVILVVAGRISDPGSKATLEVEAATVSSNRPSLLPPRFDHPAFRYAAARLDSDFSAVETFRPSYSFWQHIFTIPDGAVAFGSANDGRLLASFPRRGNWVRDARWADATLVSILEGLSLPSNRRPRRDRVATVLETYVGPVVHNETRGNFLLPNAKRYGDFLDEWGAIYERFGVPAEIGLAQAIIESGLNGRIRSEARALGFCQWLERNWNRMKRFAPNVIEGYNQTTQAPYCAAYLTVLATKYGSFIPALSEHHTGAANVGRTVINGARLGAMDIRERYFLGAAFAVELRQISLRRYREIFRTYGPRSSLYAEMVFGNTFNVTNLKSETSQTHIFAMRAPRAIPLSEVTRRTGLTVQEVRRFNPALVRQVPACANLYLPSYVEEFGPDVSFWHREPSPAYVSVLDDFVRLDEPLERWNASGFESVLGEFKERFKATETEEGDVMATVLAYVIDELTRDRQREILSDFQASSRIQSLFERGLSELQRSPERRARLGLPP